MIWGGVDDVWINSKKELIVAEFKVTVKERIKMSPVYKKQLEFYSWLFKNNNYSVSDSGYVLFCRLTSNQDFSEDWSLKFEPVLVECVIDDSWVLPAVHDALLCLDNTELPSPGMKFLEGNQTCEKCKILENWIKLL